MFTNSKHQTAFHGLEQWESKYLFHYFNIQLLSINLLGHGPTTRKATDLVKFLIPKKFQLLLQSENVTLRQDPSANLG